MKKIYLILLLALLSICGIAFNSYADTTVEGAWWSQRTSCTTSTAEGQGCWDTDNDIFYIGDGTNAKLIGGSSLGDASAASLYVTGGIVAGDVSATTTWGSSMTGTGGAVRQLNATLTTPTINSPQLTGASANTITATDGSFNTMWGLAYTGTTGKGVRDTSPTISGATLTGVTQTTVLTGTSATFTNVIQAASANFTSRLALPGSSVWNDTAVGVGIATPGAKFHVYDTYANDPFIRLSTANANTTVELRTASNSYNPAVGSFSTGMDFGIFSANTQKINLGGGPNGAINFYNGTGNVIFNGSGNVGIGTTSPSVTGLDVSGNLAVTGGASSGAITGKSVAVTGDVSGATVRGVLPNQIIGDGTAGRVLRVFRLDFVGGTTPGTHVNIGTENSAPYFNAPTISAATDISVNTTSGSFSMNSDGKVITLDLTQNIIGVVSISYIYGKINSAGAVKYYMNVSLSSGNLPMTISAETSTANVDWRSVLTSTDYYGVVIAVMTDS